MKKLTISLFLTIFTVTLMAKLPPKIEFDRFIQKADEFTKSKKYEKAYDYYKKASKLKTKKPDNFYYDYGNVIYRLKIYTESQKASWKDAKKAFENYLSIVGEKGKHYKDALSSYTNMEEKEMLKHVKKRGA